MYKRLRPREEVDPKTDLAEIRDVDPVPPPPPQGVEEAGGEKKPKTKRGRLREPMSLELAAERARLCAGTAAFHQSEWLFGSRKRAELMSARIEGRPKACVKPAASPWGPPSSICPSQRQDHGGNDDDDVDGMVWEKSARTNIAGKSSDDGSRTLAPVPSIYFENGMQMPEPWFAESAVHLALATFVRALGDSEPGSKPSFRKGDILRIIGDRWRGDLDFQLLPLKPPGETGQVLRSGFEGVGQEVADQVWREASSEEEKEAFRRAVEWED